VSRSIWFQRPVLAWAVYDWANSAFSLTVITAFVPVMLGEFWSDGAPSTVTTFRLGVANSVASLLVAVFSPVLGAIADRANRRKHFLIVLAGLGIVMTGSLFMVAEGHWFAGLFCYVCASIGFAGGNTFYDSLLVDVSAPEHVDEVSAYGFGLGYIGGALLFAFNVLLVSNPQWFGLESAFAAIRIAFLLVALWWAVFSLPLMFWVREHAVATPVQGSAISGGLRQLRDTVRAVRLQRNLLIFLCAYWLYIDGVDTIIRMAGDYGLAIGLGRQQVILALLVANFVGFPAALGFGWLGRHYGPKLGIYLALTIYVIATTLAAFIDSAVEFFLLAGTIGLVQGGVQSLSRSLYVRLIPRDKAAEYFGFYNMLGKFAAIIGPIMTGYTALLFGSQRWGILSLLVLFLSGMWLLSRVTVPQRAV
jgi:UMF1 family MFS transporter